MVYMKVVSCPDPALSRGKKGLVKPKESAGCHQTLSSRVGAGHETNMKEAIDNSHIMVITSLM